MAITHTFVSAVEDGADETLVRPSNWNADHSGIITTPKTADETVNNSNTLQNDDDLLFAIGTVGTWAFRIVLFYHGNAAQDIKFAITVPAAATLCWSMGAGLWQINDIWVSSNVIITSGSGVATHTIAAGEGSARACVLNGWVKSGGTAGNVQLQWAQLTAAANDTIVMEESYLIAHQLA